MAANPKQAAQNVKTGAKKIEPLIQSARKHADGILTDPMAPGVEAKIAPMVKDFQSKLDAIKSALAQFEQGIDKYSARA